MTDEDLARDLNIPVELVPKITAEKRVMYERLIGLSDELTLWQAGVAPKPKGVIVCMPHKRGIRHG